MDAAGPDVRIAVCGLGFAGLLHARAVLAAGAMAELAGRRPRLVAVADSDRRRAAALADRLPDCEVVESWQALAARSDLDGVIVALPNRLHAPACVDLLAAGTAVLVEKPLAASLADAAAIRAAALPAFGGVRAGYLFLESPAIAWARQEVASGGIGRPVHLAICHREDYGAGQTRAAMGWRADPAQAGFGALGDLGAHAVSVAMALCGPVASVAARMGTVTGGEDGAPARPTDDHVAALLAFETGALATVQASRVAHGRKMHLAFELSGSRGTLRFDHQRPNEIAVARDRGGFTTHLIGPEHPHYGDFLPAAGHGLGFADLFTIQVRRWIGAVVEGERGREARLAALEFAWQVELVLHAIARAGRQGAWVVPHDLDREVRS